MTIAALITAGPLVAGAIASTLVLGVFAYGAIKNTEPSWQRPNYDDAAAFIDASAAPDDVVLDVAGLPVGGTDGKPLAPPAYTLDINFDQPHKAFDAVTPAESQRALAEAAGSRLYLVGHPFFVTGARASLGLGEQTPVLERSYERTTPLILQAFDVPPDQ